MGIVDEDVAKVRDVTDIVAVISQYTQLKRSGSQWMGLCPFHGEKSPSFSVNGDQGVYYCFGCQVRGDAITFVREKEQLDFVGAVEWLANKAGVSLRYTDKFEGEDRKRKARLSDAVEQAVGWYHDRLLTSADAGAARSYLRTRGFDGDMVRRYRIGWAPDGWDLLARSLKLNDADLTDAGLGFVNRRGRQQDSFRNRVLFPIFDAQGAAVGFGGRILPGGDGPKYKNSADNRVYHKSRILYGLNWAKTEVVEADEVIVCEGYTDVIGFARAGVPRAVATCGTSLTEDHVKLLRRFARRVVLAFDADAAGQTAAEKFYQWEKAHDLDVAVVDLPDGVDPGELSLSDPARLATAVADSKPFLAFQIERVFDRADLSTVESRAKTAEAALGLVAEHPDALVRDQYAMDIATRCRLELDLVRQWLREGRFESASDRSQRRDRERGGRGGRAAPSRGGGFDDAPPPWETGSSGGGQPEWDDAPPPWETGYGGDPVPSPGAERRSRLLRREAPELERKALRAAIQQPDEILPYLVPELFTDDVSAELVVVLSGTRSLHEVVETVGEDHSALVHRLATERITDPAIEVACMLWRGYLEREERHVARTVADLAEASRYQQWMRERRRDLVDVDDGRRAAVLDELLGWIAGADGEGEA